MHSILYSASGCTVHYSVLFNVLQCTVQRTAVYYTENTLAPYQDKVPLQAPGYYCLQAASYFSSSSVYRLFLLFFSLPD